MPAWTLAVALPASADLAELQARGTLRVLVAADELAEMFALQQRAEGAGLEREMLEAFAKAQRLRLEVVPVARFDEMIPRLVARDGDVIVGMIDTEGRRRTIAFTTEVLPARHTVVTRRPQPALRTVDELRAARVGVVAGTTWADEAVAARLPASQLRQFDSVQGVMAGLRAGAIRATILSVSDFLLEQRRDPLLESGLLLGAPARAAWGVRQEDQRLLGALDRHIDDLRSSAGWGRLVTKYFSDGALSVLGRARRPGP